MNYETFIRERSKLNELYNVVRKSDGKEILRCANFSQTYNLTHKDKHLYEINYYNNSNIILLLIIIITIIIVVTLIN